MNRCVARALSLAAASLCAACLWLPDHGQLGRGEFPPVYLEQLVSGQSTRADVLLALGEPDWVSADQQRMLYWVTEVHSWFFVYLVADAATSYVCTDHLHLFEFDQLGVLCSRRVVEQSKDYSTNGTWLWKADADCEALFRSAGTQR